MSRSVPPTLAAVLIAGLAFGPLPSETASAQGVAPSGSAATAAGRGESLQDLAAVARAAEAFALQRLSREGRGGRVVASDVTSTPMDPRLRLPSCTRLSAFLPAGRSLSGRTTVGVRCDAPVAWRVYVQVAIRGDGPNASGNAPAGAAAMVPTAAVVGRPPGAAATARTEPVVSAGQNVHVEVRGAGFSVRAEGTALAAAAPGEAVRVRIANGRVVSGIAQPSGTVEIGI